MKNFLYFIAATTLFSPYTHATQLEDVLNKTSIYINKCNYRQGYNALDLALINKGYFVLRRGKSGDFLYTRFGKFDSGFGSDPDFISFSHGIYLQGINSNGEMANISSSFKDVMDAKATDSISLQTNLNASDDVGTENSRIVTIYDSLGAPHDLALLMKKQKMFYWEVAVEIDSQPVSIVKLIFNHNGKISDESGLQEIKWDSPQGIQVLNMNSQGSTQFDAPFQINKLIVNGNQAGNLVGLSINEDGEFQLMYSNGKAMKWEQSIAVAFIDNPKKLRKVMDNLYAPTKAAGEISIQPANSYGAILSGYLETKRCFPEL